MQIKVPAWVYTLLKLLDRVNPFNIRHKDRLVTNLNEIVNQSLIEQILEVTKQKKIELSHIPSEITIGGSNSTDVAIISQHFEISKRYAKLISEILESYDEADIKKVHALYYYGRSFTDGSMSKTTSFDDFLEYHKDDTMNDILRKINGTMYHALLKSWNVAKEKFDEHEKNAPKEKEIFNKRLKSYTKKGADTFFEFSKKENKASTNQVFQNVFKKYQLWETSEINLAKNIIDSIIEETNGQVVVDFLGNENFDHLNFVENDDEVLKLYWKYSMGNNKYPVPPHNIRVDIAFEKLELIKYSENNVAIALKGYYRDKNEIKQYYYNKEKIKQMHSIEEVKWSLFYNELNFDKKQRGSLENFRVTFLPWRYYNILILPKENLPSVDDTTKILILKNLFDIEDSLKKTIMEFKTNFFEDEESITMYGNRLRKIVEKLLKFILLASKIMFKENYEKDMLGNILDQMKNEVAKEEDYYNFYDKDILYRIIKKLEDDGLLEKLNLCSHDNVKHKINKTIIDDIYDGIEELVQNCYKYFKLTV